MSKVDFVGLQLAGDADGEFLFVNPEWVMAFGKDEDGLVAVVLHDGQSLKVKHSVEELVELFKR